MLPTILKPMLAQKADAPFDSADHLFEIKWDGIRCLAFVENGRVRLQSRHLLDITSQFPELGCFNRLPAGTVLDGELVVFKDGQPCFEEIQRRAQLQQVERIAYLSRYLPVCMMAFDLLYAHAKPLLREPLALRREALEKLAAIHPAPAALSVPPAIRYHGRRVFAEVAARGMEGIIAKRIDSPYLVGLRSRLWWKVKCRRSQTRPTDGC